MSTQQPIPENAVFLGVLRDANTGRTYATFNVDGLLVRGYEDPRVCSVCCAIQHAAYLEEGRDAAHAIPVYPCTNPAHRRQ